MVEKSEIIQIDQRIRAIKSRLGTCSRHRLKYTQENEKLSQNLIDTLVKLLQRGEGKRVGVDIDRMIDQTAIEIRNNLAQINRGWQVTVQVIDHPRHLPVIKQYFEQIPENVKKFYEQQIAVIENLFTILRRWVVEKAYPIIVEADNAMEKFRQTCSISRLLEYVELEKKAKNAYAELELELKPRLGEAKKVISTVTGMIKRVSEFGDDHKKAVALLTVSVILLGFVVELIVPPAGIIGGIFMGLKIMHKFLNLTSTGIGSQSAIADLLT